MISCNMGGNVVTWAGVEAARGVVIELGQAVAAAFQRLVESRVMLGHVLTALRGGAGVQAFEAFCRSTGLHKRRISEAMRMAREFATAEGLVDWDKYRALVGLKAKPSVRALVKVIAEREKAERAAKAPAPELVAQVDRLAEEAATAKAAEAAALEARRVAAAAEAAFAGLLEAATPTAPSAVVEEVRAATPAALVLAAGQVAGPGAEKGARGRQLDMGPLFEEAWAMMRRLEDVCARIGVGAGAFGELRRSIEAAQAA